MEEMLQVKIYYFCWVRGKQVQVGGIPTIILPAESSKSWAAGTLASHIASHLSYKPHHDLNTYKG